ncbi:MAG: heme-binding domain-containing protein [Williamsia sp.]|nr:heme-binding domain-containing protein [Williamsia sp.]
MRILKKILWVPVVLLITIQFIRPARNNDKHLLTTDIIKTVPVPDTVLGILKSACYDCHSNSTRYPWYVNIQPVAWMMAGHIKQGKADLNFSEFGAYSKRKQAHKLRAVSEVLLECSMPLSSYTLIHTDARLDEAEKKIIIAWALKMQDNLSKK